MFCKVRVWKGYFLQLIKEKLTNLDKFPTLNYHKILNRTFFVTPTRISNKIPTISMSDLKSWSPLIFLLAHAILCLLCERLK